MTAGVRRPAPPMTTARRVELLKVREPVRFYLWPAIAVMVLVLVVDAGGAVGVGLQSLALVLLLAATQAARATAWTLPGIIAAFRDGDERLGRG